MSRWSEIQALLQRFVEHEVTACAEPGAVDGGTHILFAATPLKAPRSTAPRYVLFALCRRPRRVWAQRRSTAGAQALRAAYLGAETLRNPWTLSGMQNILSDHMRNFVDGKVSVVSLSMAAQAERVDRDTANAVLMLLAGWEHSAHPGNDLRARVQHLI